MADKRKGMSRRDLLTFWRRASEPEPVRPSAPPQPEDEWPRDRVHGPSFGRRLPLRPPGNMQEYILRDACTRCGNCVEACPADAIYSLGAEWGQAQGTPAIDPRKSPCVLCEGFKCTQNCPSGALQPLFNVAEIKMGAARIDAGLCLTYLGQACKECVTACPVPGAIGLDADQPIAHPRVEPYTCVGCGLCVRACPTPQTAIDVVPRD
jgi:MauM/NapG family ferredoxin protein